MKVKWRHRDGEEDDEVQGKGKITLTVHGLKGTRKTRPYTGVKVFVVGAKRALLMSAGKILAAGNDRGRVLPDRWEVHFPTIFPTCRTLVRRVSRDTWAALNHSSTADRSMVSPCCTFSPRLDAVSCTMFHVCRGLCNRKRLIS